MRRVRARDWPGVLKRAGKEFVDDGATALAKQIAYSSLLAFFPTVIFLVGLLGLVDGYDALLEFLGPVAPQGVLDTIAAIQRNAPSSGASLAAFALGAAGAVWAASGAMNAIITAVNRAYDRTDTRPGWRVRLIAIVLVLLTGIVTAAVFLLIVFGEPLGAAIADRAGLGSEFDVAWGILRWPIAFLAVLLFFGLVYALAPDTRQRRRARLSAGAVVGSVLWLALSGLFALYTSVSGSYSETYGSLAGGIVLLLWLNYSAFALIFGAELDSELEREAAVLAAGGPNAGLTKPSRRVR